MLYTAISGRYAPGLGRADGDSIRFIADDPSHFDRLERVRFGPDLNQSNGSITLRLQSIDAMEREARATDAAPNEAQSATRRLLECLGVPSGLGERRGMILSRALDEHGRPLGFAYAGDAAITALGLSDGARRLLKPRALAESVNHLLVREGWAYPLFYEALAPELRSTLTWAACGAERAGRGVWAADASLSGAAWTGAAGLKALPPLFPKLWRRLRDYAERSPYADRADRLEAFRAFLLERGDLVRIAGRTGPIPFADVVRVRRAEQGAGQGDCVALTAHPSELIFR